MMSERLRQGKAYLHSLILLQRIFYTLFPLHKCAALLALASVRLISIWTGARLDHDFGELPINNNAPLKYTKRPAARQTLHQVAAALKNTVQICRDTVVFAHSKSRFGCDTL